MPPHSPDEPPAGAGAGDDSPVPGLPVHHRILRPGAIVTGCVVVAVAALLAHASSLGGGLVWDDRAFLLEDERVRRLSSAVTGFGDSFFGPLARNEMYRPLVNASLALDWFVSGSAEGAPRTAWFHAVNWLLHAANAALVYLLLAGLTKRRLGAPLLAATLWAVHPLAVEPVTWIVGRCDLLAAFFGLSSAVLLVRSPGKPRVLAASVVLWGIGLFAKASIATLPVIVALALVAYHEVEPSRFLTPRLRNRFLVFAVPAVVWLAARTAVLGWPFPEEHGRRWHDFAVTDGALSVGRAFLVQTLHVFLPVRLSGHYAADPASTAGAPGAVGTGVLGLALLAGCVAFGVARLRRHRFAFPLLAYVLALLPVLQIVPIGAVLADRFLYLPMAFLLLGVAEGLEALYYRWAGVRGLTVTLVLFLVLPLLSHLRAPVWRDEATFWRDVLVSYPDDRDARYRLAKALSETGRAEDRAEAKAALAAEIDASERSDEVALLGALHLEDGDLAAAEPLLRRAVAMTPSRPKGGALARYNLAVLLKRTGRTDEAARWAEDALRLEPDLAAARRLLDSLH